MKHKLLSLLVMTAGMSLVACGGDDKGGVAQAPVCGGGPCSMQQAALAQVPGSPEQKALLAGKITPPGAPGLNTAPLGQVPGVVDPNGRKPYGLASVSDKQIQMKAASVFAKLEADKHNPDSPYYVGDQASAEPIADRAPSSVALPQVAEAQLAPVAIQGGGEAAH